MQVPPKSLVIPQGLIALARAPMQATGKAPFSPLLMPTKPIAPQPMEKRSEAHKDTPLVAKSESTRKHKPDDALDPLARQTAQLAPPMLSSTPIATPSEVPVAARVHVSLEDLVPALVRKIAWAGDGRKGSVRMELGAGELAGSVLVVHADDGKVRVELSVPAGVDADAWRTRLEKRLIGRGLDLDCVDVR
jgi:hypothetical protein